MIRMSHARAMGYCARGVRMWCRLHGIDYMRLLGDGVPAHEVLAVDDEFGRRVVEMAMQDSV